MPSEKRTAENNHNGEVKKRRLGGEQEDYGSRVRQDIFTDGVLKKYTADYASSKPYVLLLLASN